MYSADMGKWSICYGWITCLLMATHKQKIDIWNNFFFFNLIELIMCITLWNFFLLEVDSLPKSLRVEKTLTRWPTPDEISFVTLKIMLLLLSLLVFVFTIFNKSFFVWWGNKLDKFATKTNFNLSLSPIIPLSFSSEENPPILNRNLFLLFL